MSKRIHPTALIDPRAEIDPSCEIGPFCIIGPHVQIGPNNKLLGHVTVDNRVQIGEGNTFYPYSYIGAEPADLKYKGEDTSLIIGNNNKFREFTSIHLGTGFGGGVTKIGNDCLIMAYTHLGHDCIVGNSVIITNSCQIAGHVIIEDFVSIGGLTGITQFVRIGAHTYVGGFSGISKDVVPYSMALGRAEVFSIRGVNIVGLRRRGFSNETISSLMEAQKIFFKEGLEKAAALEKIEEKFPGIPEVAYFVDFIRKSESGVHR